MKAPDQSELREVLEVLAGYPICPRCGQKVKWAARKVPFRMPGEQAIAKMWSEPCGCTLTLEELVSIRLRVWAQDGNKRGARPSAEAM